LTLVLAGLILLSGSVYAADSVWRLICAARGPF
jgi:hypothetical protein